MLKRLTIENFGLVERAEIEFARGSTMFTGETGSGKTMVIGALAFALGARSDPGMLRTGAARARAALEIDPSPALRRGLADAGIALDDGEYVLIERELYENGKSALRINGSAGSASGVRTLAVNVAEIIGQHEAQRLLAPRYHLELLDRFAGEDTLALAAAVRERYAELRELEKALDDLSGSEARAFQEYEFAQFAAAEIRSAALAPGEDESLLARQRFAANAERIANAASGAYRALSEGERSAGEALGNAAASLASASGYEPQLEEARERTLALQSEVREVALELARLMDRAETNPAELDALNERLALLERLKKKYGGTLDAVIGAGERFEETVNRFSTRDRRRFELQAELERTRGEFTALCADLGERRRAAAARLENEMNVELAQLAMQNARFVVLFEAVEPAAQGAERAEFGIAPHAEEEVRPLRRVASGGELSRILLALILVAEADAEGALVFDEVDAGIGGATAVAVGERLGRLALRRQVLCVTHLAQLASWAEAHYFLEKRQSNGRATIALKRLNSQDSVVAEIARMLSGDARQISRKHAQTLLADVRSARRATAIGGV